MFAVNADGAGSELAKGTPPVLTAFKDKPAFVPAQFHKGEFPQFLIIRKRNVAPDQRPPMSTRPRIVKLAFDGAGCLVQGGRKRRTQGVDLFGVHRPIHAVAFGVPAQVIDRHARGQKTSVPRHDLSSGRVNGSHTGRKFLSPTGPLVVLHDLDHEDAPKHKHAHRGQHHEDQPDASCICGGVHSSADKRMGGDVGCSRPSSAVDRASRLC